MTEPRSTGEVQRNPWLVLVTLCLGFFMVLLDGTSVNVAIPDITTQLSASLDEVVWVLNGYILVFVVLLITAGRLGDRYGPKRVFLTGLVIFTAASVACGLARSPDQLVIARIAQGVGGALLTPQTIAMLAVIFPEGRRGAAFGVWGAVAGVATVAGPTIGGALVTAFGWRWVFLINLAIGGGALIAAWVVLPDLRFNRRHRFDRPGTALATAGLFLVTYGLIEGQSHGWGEAWGPVTIPMIMAAGVAVLGVFGWQQYHHRDREPLVPLAIFAGRDFLLMNLVGVGIGFAMLGLSLPLVFHLQSVLGLTPLQAGLVLAPMAIMSLFVAPFAGRLADRHGGKYPLLAGVAMFALGVGMILASTGTGATALAPLPGLVVAGLGIAFTFAPLQTIAMRDVEPRFAGAASGLLNTSRQLGALLGSAAAGATLQAQLAVGPADTAAELTPERVFGPGLADAVRVALALPLVVLVVAVVGCLFVRDRAAPHVTGRLAAPRTASARDSPRR